MNGTGSPHLKSPLEVYIGIEPRMSYRQIGKALNCSPQSVQLTLNIALVKLAYTYRNYEMLRMVEKYVEIRFGKQIRAAIRRARIGTNNGD